ncbi:MAG: hypothetical protein ACTSQA_00125 [Candidatus Heimdallarchaeaceae archaeon]
MHIKKLEELCQPRGLKSIGEIPGNIHLIIKEPIIEKPNWTGLEMSPDLFIAKYNGLYTVAELKHSHKQRQKAFSQIENGMKTLVDVFGVPLRNITGKFVIYTPNSFRYEIFK